MAKENFSKTHTGKRREYRKNGDVYVFERITAYDPEKKQTVTVKEKLLGKIIAGDMKFRLPAPSARRSLRQNMRFNVRIPGQPTYLNGLARHPELTAML